MPNKDTTPLSLYGNDREYLREQERTNELLADIAGETYESPGDIPKGKYIVQKRMLDAAQKKNELLESIAEGGGTGGGAAKGIGIDYATDVISLKNKDGATIEGSGATLPAYGVSFDPTTGGLTLTKNGTAMQGQTVTIPNYGSPVGVTDSADMVDEGTIYLYEGTTGGGYTQGHFYYWDGTAWADGGEYAAATVQTDKTLLVENRAADAKAVGDAVSNLKESLAYYETTETLSPTYETGYYGITNGYVNENKTTANTIRTTRLAVTAGEKFRLTGIPSANGPLFILTDNTLLVKDSSGNGVALTDYDVIASTDGYLYFQPKAADTYSIARYYLREENKKAMAVYGRLIDVLRNTAFINASGGAVLKRFADEIDVDGWLDVIGSYTINSDTGNIAPTDQNYRAVSSWFDVGSSTAITSEFTDGSIPSMKYAIYCYNDSKAYIGRGDPTGAQPGATLVSFPTNTQYIRFLFIDSSFANIVDKITGRIARFTLTNDGTYTEVVYCLTKTEDLNNVI